MSGLLIYSDRKMTEVLEEYSEATEELILRDCSVQAPLKRVELPGHSCKLWKLTLRSYLNPEQLMNLAILLEAREGRTSIECLDTGLGKNEPTTRGSEYRTKVEGDEPGMQ